MKRYSTAARSMTRFARN